MADRFQSNALWPPGTCFSKWGDNISTDTHATVEQSAAVCRMLRVEGFGGERKVFPLFVWTSPVQQPPVLPRHWNWQPPPHYENPREALTPVAHRMRLNGPRGKPPAVGGSA